jgi:hypothetical protein
MTLEETGEAENMSDERDSQRACHHPFPPFFHPAMMMGMMGRDRRGDRNLREVENSMVAMTVLAQLVKDNPGNIKDNIELALQYAQEARKQGAALRALRSAREAVVEEQRRVDSIKADIEADEKKALDAMNRRDEAQKLLTAANCGDKPRTEIAKGLATEIEGAENDIEDARSAVDERLTPRLNEALVNLGKVQVELELLENPTPQVTDGSEKAEPEAASVSNEEPATTIAE